MSSSRPKTNTPPPLAQAVIDDLLDLFYCNLSDEACAHIAEFLSDLTFLFETVRFAQIRRHHHSLIPDPSPSDPRQLDLFTDLPPF